MYSNKWINLENKTVTYLNYFEGQGFFFSFNTNAWTLNRKGKSEKDEKKNRKRYHSTNGIIYYILAFFFYC